MALIITNFKCPQCGYTYRETKKRDGKVYRTAGNKVPLVFEAITRFVQTEFSSNAIRPTISISAILCPHCGHCVIDVPESMRMQVIKNCTLEPPPAAPGDDLSSGPPQDHPRQNRSDRGFDFN